MEAGTERERAQGVAQLRLSFPLTLHQLRSSESQALGWKKLPIHRAVMSGRLRAMEKPRGSSTGVQRHVDKNIPS